MAVCPSCGYCPTCGRSNRSGSINWPYTHPFPYITGGAQSGLSNINQTPSVKPQNSCSC